MILTEGTTIFTKGVEDCSYHINKSYVILGVVFQLEAAGLLLAQPVRNQGLEPTLLFVVNCHQHYNILFADTRPMTPLEQAVYLNGPSEAYKAF